MSTGETWLTDRSRLVGFAVVGLVLGLLSLAAAQEERVTGPTQGRVVLSASPLESGAVQEPDVWHDGERWHMVYSAGWENSALAWATAAKPGGPWTRHGVILGNGAGGWDRPVSHHSVFVEDGVHYVYFPSDIDGVSGQLRVAVGRDLANLTVRPGVVLDPPPGATGPVNTSVIKDGDVYRMLFESKVDDPSWWNMGYATAPSPLGPFTIVKFPLKSLQRGENGMFGGPDLHKIGDRFVLWYHAATDGNTILPTDIYRATSTDLVNWTATEAPIVRRTWEQSYDQYADPVLVVRPRGAHLFWSGMLNTVPSGVVLTERLDRLRLG